MLERSNTSGTGLSTRLKQMDSEIEKCKKLQDEMKKEVESHKKLQQEHREVLHTMKSEYNKVLDDLKEQIKVSNSKLKEISNYLDT